MYDIEVICDSDENNSVEWGGQKWEQSGRGGPWPQQPRPRCRAGVFNAVGWRDALCAVRALRTPSRNSDMGFLEEVASTPSAARKEGIR